MNKNSQKTYEITNTEAKEFIQQTTREEGERVGVEQVQFDNVLQKAPEEGSKSEEIQTKRLSKEWSEQNPFQVGERIMDILTQIRGTVVAIESEKVFFYCQEFGKVWRQWELLMKVSNNS